MQGKIIYFDIAAVPIYILILLTIMHRRLAKGRTNALFLIVASAALVTVLCDIAAEAGMWEYPLTQAEVSFVKATQYLYFVMRNGFNMVYLFFIYSVMRCWYRIVPHYRKALLTVPYLLILLMLFTNEKTHAVFSVTPESGYVRGSLILAVYVFAMFYFAYGVTFLIIYRKTVDVGAWVSLLALYMVNLVGVFIQLVYPRLLVECFLTSVTLLLVILFVQRPEKQADISTGLPAYRAFREEMEKIKITGQRVQIVIVSVKNADELNRFLGDKSYSDYIHSIERSVKRFTGKERISCELYYEQPGFFYIILDDAAYNPVQAIPAIRETVRKAEGGAYDRGAVPDIRIVTVAFPEEISDTGELFRFAHDFDRFADVDRVFVRAKSIIGQRPYQIEAHLDEILERAIESNRLIIEYQPVWSVEDRVYRSAEAVISIRDDVFDEIDGNLLMKAAEARGLSIRLGELVMEQVFSFVGSRAFSEKGLSTVTIMLSMNHCMQLNFVDIVWNLREKYEVHPEQICFAIKETVYENMSAQFDENIRQLHLQGYLFSLDGYGRGYSNMQHILELPIESVRLDRSMLDSASSEGGRALLKGSIQMLKSIPLEVIAQGVDTRETAEMLIDMGCDCLQGAVAYMV